MIRVGLTGGAGSGKSEAAAIWRSLGVPVLCADDVAREETTSTEEVLDAIRGAFGDDFFTDSGHLKRQMMREEITTNADSKKKLESIVHPLVRCAITRWLEQQDAPYAVIVVPLLIESGMDDLVDVVAVMDCPYATQVERIIGRDQCSRQSAEQLIHSQLPSKLRLDHADAVLLNDDTKEKLKQRIAAFHGQLQNGVYDLK